VSVSASKPLDEPHDPASTRRSGLVVVGLVIALLLPAVWLVRVDDGPVPPFLGGPRPEPGEPSAPAAIELLDVAGSGSNLPITHALAAAYRAPLLERPAIHDSIGSGGGVRALLDGAIELAIVSRPLAPTERELGLVETPYARVPVMFAVNASVTDIGLEPEDVLAVFSGERTTWSDGTPIVVLMRERGDSSHRAVASGLPGFAEVSERAWDSGHFRVLYHDDDMREAIAVTPGAIGLYGQGSLPPGSPIRALRVSGVEPTLDAMATGAYPFAKDLLFVSRGPPRGAAGSFVAFAQSPEGREVVRTMGGLALGEIGR
jgi:phosphate transport system substrate-binding protein